MPTKGHAIFFLIIILSIILLQASNSLRQQLGVISALGARNYSATHESDIVVIGSGPGGYVAAIKASQLGLKVNFFNYF